MKKKILKSWKRTIPWRSAGWKSSILHQLAELREPFLYYIIFWWKIWYPGWGRAVPQRGAGRKESFLKDELNGEVPFLRVEWESFQKYVLHEVAIIIFDHSLDSGKTVQKYIMEWAFGKILYNNALDLKKNNSTGSTWRVQKKDASKNAQT